MCTALGLNQFMVTAIAIGVDVGQPAWARVTVFLDHDMADRVHEVIEQYELKPRERP